jgi:hypothetical protein
MAKSKIKKQLHTCVDMIGDESQLEMLHDAAEKYATKKQPDILDMLTNEQLERLNQSIQQIKEGKVISHEKVIKISRQWLMK